MERYRDSAALLEHATNIGDLMGAIGATGRVSAEVLGVPSDELRAALDGGPVQLFTPNVSL